MGAGVGRPRPTTSARVYARYMEAFAGYLSHTDHHVGRFLDALADDRRPRTTRSSSSCSDNGASSEGGVAGSLNDGRVWNFAPRTVEEAVPVLDEIGGPRWHNNYPWGWTVAGNTPFRRWKREVHEGGVADPLIVVVAASASPTPNGGIRDQYVHAIDILPTVLEARRASQPPAPVDGVSFAPTFGDADAPDRAHRAVLRDVRLPRVVPGRLEGRRVPPDPEPTSPASTSSAWELYHVAVDPSETHDLAAAEPERLRAMVELWWEEAERNHVLPLDNRPFADFVFDRPADGPRARRRTRTGPAPAWCRRKPR